MPHLQSEIVQIPVTLAQVVAGATQMYGERPAMELGERSVTFAELSDLAGRWAHALRERAPQVQRVGVLGSRSLESFAGALAASWAGACFVPLNPRLHPERLTRVVRLAELDAVIVDPMWQAVLEVVRPELMPGAVVLSPADAALHTPISPVAADAQALAYLLFTSGTTGAPKGVGVTNANVMAYLHNARARFDFAPTDRFSQMFEQSFDVSIFDLFVAWSVGACVVGISAEQLIAPASYIEENALTVFSSVPSVLSLMRRRRALRPGRFPAMRYSMFAGEALSVENAAAWAAAAPHAAIDNMYGPTETTVVCTGYRWHGVDPSWPVGSVPIGRPLNGVTLRVVDEHGSEVAAGETGELLVGGRQTVPGYWKAPQITAEKFIAVPLASGDVTTFYKTGDLVQALPSGDLAFIGRADHQLKVLGRRIEPGEIEAVARTISGVDDAVCVGWPIEDGHPVALTLFVVGDVSNEPEARVRLAAELSARLEPALTPRRVEICRSLPLNVNGKVDRHALLQALRSHNGEPVVSLSA